MPVDPHELFLQAAATPSRSLDMDHIESRARQKKVARAVAAGAALLLIATGGMLVIPDLMNGRDRQTFQPGPTPQPSESAVTERSNTNWTTRVDWDNRYAILYPEEWFAAEESLTPKLVDPRELFTVGSFPLEYRENDCHNMPKPAFDSMSTEGAFLSIQEAGDLKEDMSFPPRKIFSPDEIETTEGFMCLEQEGVDVFWFTFRDSGRNFYALIAVGEDADRRTASAPWFVLNNATFFPAEQSVDRTGAFYPEHYYNGHGFNVMPLVFPDGTRAHMMFPLEMELEDFQMVPYAFVRLGDSGCCALEARFVYGTDRPFLSYAEPSGRTFPGWDGGSVELWEPKQPRDSRLLVYRFGEWRLGVSLHNDRDMPEEEMARFAGSLEGAVTPEGFLALRGHDGLQVLSAPPPIGPGLNLWSVDERQGVLLSHHRCDEQPRFGFGGWTNTNLQRSNGQVSWCQDGQIEIRVNYGKDEGFGQTAIDSLRFLDIEEPE